MTPDLSPARRRAVTDWTSDLAVTAGAGAGKTTVLVDRFVGIARSDPRGPDALLAITFTRKAAVEMKARVIRTFENSGEVDLRRRTEAAYISTIHGFSERLLRERPFDARLDPAFKVLTEYDQALFLEQALQDMYGRPELLAHAARLGRDFSGRWHVFRLVDVVARLLREGPDTAAREAALVHDREAFVQDALERAREHAALLEREMLRLMAALKPALANAQFKSFRQQWETSRRYLEALEACVQANSVAVADPAIWRQTGYTGQMVENDRSKVRPYLDAIKSLAADAAVDWEFQERLEHELYPLKRDIYLAAQDIGDRYAAFKRARNALDFNDLQRRVSAMLQDHAHVRQEYAERFSHILLDESQDTDSLQFGIVQQLRHDGNTLFMVGDPKQAIYEFRGANPDVFSEALQRMPEDARLDLPENFRSRPEIISFVNGIGTALLGDRFTHILGRADYGDKALDAPAITALWAIRESEPDDNGDERPQPLGTVREREAAALAEEIATLLVQRPLVRDPDRREVEWIPLQPRHVAVLFRTRSVVPYVERALADRGIPYVTAAGQGFYDRAEVLDGIMMLRVISQPLDNLALAAVLRSPFFGVSDADLWRLTRAARATSGDPPPIWQALMRDERLAHIARRIHDLRRRVRGLPASAALEEALNEFDYEPAIAAHSDGPAMLANLAKLRRRLRELGAATPHEAVAELQRTRELMQSEPLAPLVGTADDVVVLTTIHQAKGLEWPVVCLPNLQAAPRKHGDGFSARHGLLLCEAIDESTTQKVKPLSVRAAEQENARRAEAEERRLLYVALTRARERLILSASVEETRLEPKYRDVYDNPLAFLLRNTAGTLTDEGEHDLGSYHTRVRHLRENVDSVTRYQGGRTLADESDALGLQVVPDDSVPDDALVPMAPPVSLKVTELLGYQRCPLVHRFSHMLDIPEHAPHRARVRGVERAELSPVDLGTRVHELLERARFHAPDVSAEVERLVSAEPQRHRSRIGRMLTSVLTGEVGDMVRNATRVERELPFAFRIGGVMLEGVIDLALQGEGGRWMVLDYKSNDISRTGRLEYLTDYYTPQLELYALALSRAGLGTVSECALVFLSGPEVKRWSLGDTAAREAWAERTVRAIAEGRYETSAGPKCEMCGYRKRKVCSVGVGYAGGGVLKDDNAVAGSRR